MIFNKIASGTYTYNVFPTVMFKKKLHPVVSSKEALDFELVALMDEAKEWDAMQRAGKGIAKAARVDFSEISPFPEDASILALVGKGHNGGDALLAVAEIISISPRAKVVCLLTEPLEALKPLTKRALETVKDSAHVECIKDLSQKDLVSKLDSLGADYGFDICIDGILGLNFKAPLSPFLSAIIGAINNYPRIRMRIAVDIPSGLDEQSDAEFLAPDFTYATGFVKGLHFVSKMNCGRVRLVDLGFESIQSENFKNEFFLTPSELDPMRVLRPSKVSKTNFGHLFIVGGSSNMPGALLMSVQAAVRSGVGLVTAFAPQSVAASLAAQVPEAMWIPWPESTNGTLSPRALPLLFDRIKSATALLIGPGMGRDRNVESLVQEIINQVPLPIICDADALGTRVVEMTSKRRDEWGRVILTPHMGEFIRISKPKERDCDNAFLKYFCESNNVLTVLKSPQTRICDGERIFYNALGGPVLSRGGSGDMLAGILGGILARKSNFPVEAMQQAVVWHGLAAEFLARERGQVAVCTTDLLDYLSQVLRSY